MAGGDGRGDGGTHSSNMNGGNIQLIKAVVCAGLYPNVTVAPASLCPTSSSSPAAAGGGKAGKGGKGGAGGAQKTAGEVRVSYCELCHAFQRAFEEERG